MKNEVLLFTSGVDSYVAREYLITKGHDIDCLYFDHRGMYCEHELEKIYSLPFEVKISEDLRFSHIEEEDAHIPNRNILMTIMAHAYGYKKVWLGGTLSDRVGDNKPGVFKNLSKLITEVNEEHCEIFSPFYHCYKDDIVRWFVDQKGVEGKEELVKNTFSCFNPTEDNNKHLTFFTSKNSNKVINFSAPLEFETKECMECSACFRKCAVLRSGGIFIPFHNESILRKYQEEFESEIVQNPRVIGTLQYINDWEWFIDRYVESHRIGE